MTLKTFAAVGGPGHRIVVAPTANGKYRPLPRPYAKNSLATLKKRSAFEIPSVALAYNSVQTTMSWCRCTHPLGDPVLPDEYSQNATSSRVVGSAVSYESPAPSRSAKDSVP